MLERIALLALLFVFGGCIGCDDGLPSCRDFPSDPVGACVSGTNLQGGGNKSVTASGMVTAIANDADSICGGQDGLVIGRWWSGERFQTIEIRTQGDEIWTVGIAADTKPGLNIGDTVSLDASLTYGAFVEDTGHVRLSRDDGTILFAVAQAPTLVDVEPWLGLTLQVGTDACESQDDCGTVVGSYLVVAGTQGGTAIPPGATAQIGTLRVTNAALYHGRQEHICTDWNPESVRVAAVASP